MTRFWFLLDDKQWKQRWSIVYWVPFSSSAYFSSVYQVWIESLIFQLFSSFMCCTLGGLHDPSLDGKGWLTFNWIGRANNLSLVWESYTAYHLMGRGTRPITWWRGVHHLDRTRSITWWGGVHDLSIEHDLSLDGEGFTTYQLNTIYHLIARGTRPITWWRSITCLGEVPDLSLDGERYTTYHLMGRGTRPITWWGGVHDLLLVGEGYMTYHLVGRGKWPITWWGWAPEIL